MRDEISVAAEAARHLARIQPLVGSAVERERVFAVVRIRRPAEGDALAGQAKLTLGAQGNVRASGPSSFARTANSSPPTRATSSVKRLAVTRRSARRRSASSPCSRPFALRRRSSSTSPTSSAKGSPSERRRSIAFWKPRVFGKPVIESLSASRESSSTRDRLRRAKVPMRMPSDRKVTSLITVCSNSSVDGRNGLTMIPTL